VASSFLLESVMTNELAAMNEVTLINDDRNYVDHETLHDVRDVVLKCLARDFGSRSAHQIVDNISMSDIIVMRNAYRTLARNDAYVVHIFQSHGMSLV
jgi:hypothetical protein